MTSPDPPSTIHPPRHASRSRQGAHHLRPALHELGIVGVVAVGGGLGAVARYAAGIAWPTPAGGFPWATLAVNALGCTAIGVLMVLVTEVWAAHRLVRPFLGTGVLGGFTTFSTYAVDIQQLAHSGHTPLALSYLAATPLSALITVWAAAATTRHVLTMRRTR